MSIKNYDEIMNQIDYAIKTSWIEDIPKDYSNRYLLKEDTLKNALYFHIRKRLENLFNMTSIRMYTEYNEGPLKANKMRADIAIVEIDENSQEYYLGNRVKNVLAIIELKYNSTISYTSTDVAKIREYKRFNELDKCQFYLGFLNECWFEEISHWLDKSQTNNWAMNCVTELDSGIYKEFKDDKMSFSIYSYNKYNSDLNSENYEDMKYVNFI